MLLLVDFSGFDAGVRSAEPVDGSPIRAGYPLTVVPKTFSTRRLSVAPEFVTPPAAEQARIERERVLLGRVLAGVSPRRLWGDGFARPTDGELISRFGVRKPAEAEAGLREGPGVHC